MGTTSDSDVLRQLREDLRRFIGRRVRDAATADDLTQEVLLRAHARRHELPSTDAVRHWSFRVAANLVIDHRRRQARKPIVAGAAAVKRTADWTEADPDRPGLASCLGRMVEKLPERYRRAVELVELSGMTGREAAPVLGLSPSGTKSRVQRGRSALRRMLLDCCRVELDARGGVLGYEPTANAGRYCGGEKVCARP